MTKETVLKNSNPEIKEGIKVSPEAEIVTAAHFNPHDTQNIVRLIEKHGIAVAAEAICS